ncbi:hypothetical protein G3I59_14510 [Amycolatopsis rubida]|uniref:Uncharacterized protein n=1 Tax=Amycolatopsis rubida TaxID=112413 RepID=A0ABX0BQU9_9PSEU|nr:MULTISPECIES: hypothetical protein [Amycolatopsis]MYW91774.1 hypothetical protein [Amycolatopsis rubida]NEC56759.1 hypothetical protein [Amycolatopsis rubida]OAP21700.1 hypothetical protein A4R44_07493 [Amycolatopsis sp. M39]
MTSSDKATLSIALLVCAGVPIGLTIGLDSLLWLLLMLPLVIIPVAVHKRISARIAYESEVDRRMTAHLAAVQPPAPEPVPEPAPVRFERTEVTATALPSRREDYRFLFSATVWWRLCPEVRGPVHASPGAVAINEVVERAKAITAGELPLDHEQVRHRLNSVLGKVGPDKSGFVEVSAADVRLDLETADRERLELFAKTRKDALVWEYERKHEEDRRRYLGEDVLSDTGSAVVWWLVKQNNDVANVVKDINTLAELTAAANNVRAATGRELGYGQMAFPEDVSASERTPAVSDPSPRDSVVDLVEALMNGIGLDADAPERDLLAERLASSFAGAGKPDLADQVREAFGALDPDPSPSGPVQEELPQDGSAQGRSPSPAYDDHAQQAQDNVAARAWFHRDEEGADADAGSPRDVMAVRAPDDKAEFGRDETPDPVSDSGGDGTQPGAPDAEQDNSDGRPGSGSPQDGAEPALLWPDPGAPGERTDRVAHPGSSGADQE